MSLDTAVKASTILLATLSPSFALADHQKRGLKRAGRAKFIRRRNCTYLIIGTVLAIAAFALTWRGTGDAQWERCWPVLVPLAWYLQGRCNEVFLASYLDAFDKLRTKQRPSSALAWPTRVRLALNSYS